MFNSIIIIIGKLISLLAFKLNMGHGSTWPGHIALSLNRNFIKEMLSGTNTKTIIVAGTNGKTTTSKILATILKENGHKVLQNTSGANLLNGIASILLLNSDRFFKLNYDYIIFEVDENVLPLALEEMKPDYLIILNLFRDQLDRYGEITNIVNKWKLAIKRLDKKTTLILNADDPQVAFLGMDSKMNSIYFNCNDLSIKSNNKLQKYVLDSAYCPKCTNRLNFDTVTFSHLGSWRCSKCLIHRPKATLDILSFYPLDGVYNKYNTHAAALVGVYEGIKKQKIIDALKSFKPAFGRQEELTFKNRKVKVFLSKNPTGFNESLRTAKSQEATNILFILNDRIPDGRDVSWIWDTDLENILDGGEKITISGDRAYDMALRVKYGFQSQRLKVKDQKYNSKLTILENVKEAISGSLEQLNENDILYIIPTYTAMLEVRKILTGKKIL